MEAGATPLEYLLAVMKDPDTTQERRDWATVHCLPYCHPRLTAIAATVTQTTRPEELTDDQLAAIAAGSSTTLLTRTKARGSLTEFGRLGGFEPAAHHRLLIEKLEAVARDDIDRLMVFMPPGSAKAPTARCCFQHGTCRSIQTMR